MYIEVCATRDTIIRAIQNVPTFLGMCCWYISLYSLCCVYSAFMCVRTYVCLSVDNLLRIHSATVEIDNVKVKLEIW